MFVSKLQNLNQPYGAYEEMFVLCSAFFIIRRIKHCTTSQLVCHWSIFSQYWVDFDRTDVCLFLLLKDITKYEHSCVFLRTESVVWCFVQWLVFFYCWRWRNLKMYCHNHIYLPLDPKLKQFSSYVPQPYPPEVSFLM